MSREGERRPMPASVEVRWSGRRRVARTGDGIVAPLSIGDLSAATGIAPDTIRVWERRYGKPASIRLPSGHRRYTQEHLEWIRKVAQALARGHRTGKAVRATEAELAAMIAEPE